jgi:hypothetical protein
MKIPPVKGTRDFYPLDMAVRNWVIDGWKRVSIRNGFEEYDGPIFEYLKMFQIKSGDEIVEQLFSLKDRGGRDLAIRPEITPTLARMVNQQINSLPRPIKWFSVPRLCRAERPQKGRLREFFQWNIDIIGVDDVLADAEVIFTTLDYLRAVTSKSRPLAGSFWPPFSRILVSERTNWIHCMFFLIKGKDWRRGLSYRCSAKRFRTLKWRRRLWRLWTLRPCLESTKLWGRTTKLMKPSTNLQC